MRLIRVLSLAFWLHPLLFSSAVAKEDLLLQLATEEKQRRARVETEGRVFSNESLSQLPNARVTVSVAAEAGSGSGEGQPRQKNRMAVSIQPLADFWKSALHDAGIRLSTSVNRLHVLQLKLNSFRNQYLNASHELQRMRLEAELARVAGQLQEAEVEEVAAREGWHRVRKEALRAGLNPGEIKELQPEPPNEVSIFGDSGHRDP